MIEFKQLESGTPPDIEVTTDDSNAELVKMSDAFSDADCEELLSAQRLDSTRVGEDGKATFAIAGHEAGEVAEIFRCADLPELDSFLDKLNQERLDEMERTTAE